MYGRVSRRRWSLHTVAGMAIDDLYLLPQAVTSAACDHRANR